MKLAEFEEYKLHLLESKDGSAFEDYLELAMTHLEKAAAFTTGQFTPEKIIQKAKNNLCLIFNVTHNDENIASVLVTVSRREDGLCCSIELTAWEEGHYKTIMEQFLDDIEAHMKKRHAISNMRIVGRPGQHDLLEGLGYTPTHFLAEKRLS